MSLLVNIIQNTTLAQVIGGTSPESLLDTYRAERHPVAARVLKMLVIHDLVEIDAGDAFCYDPAANAGKEEREQLAAERIFGLLPDDQAAELHALWTEFEAGETAHARFAVALDRLQPLLLNFQHQGGSWRANAITHDRVLVRMGPIQDGAPELWPFVVRMLDEAVARGYLAPAQAPSGT